MTVYRCSTLIIVGFSLSALISLLGGLRIYAFDLYISNAVFIAFVALYPLDRSQNPVASFWYLAVGAVLHGAVFISLKQESAISEWTVFFISLTVLFIYLVFNYLSLTKIKLPQQENDAGSGIKPIVMLTLIVALTIALFRIIDALFVDIPNEQRSLMVFGVEFHHINSGIIALLVMDMLGYARQLRKYLLALVVAGIGLGSIIDQSVYYALEQITDESYRSTISLWGAIIVYVFCAGVWFKQTRSKQTGSDPITR